MLQPTIK